MTYEQWQEHITETWKLDNFYWPENRNFTPLDNRVFSDDSGVYSATAYSFKDTAQLEKYLADTDNVALLHATIEENGVIARMVHLGFSQERLEPITIEDFVKQHDLLSSNEKFGTAQGLQEQISEMSDDYGLIFYAQKCQNDFGPGIVIGKVVADRKGMLYV